jgi:hypothetical protein
MGLQTVTALLAALFWLLSAVIRIPNFHESLLAGRGSVTGVMKRQSALSAIAAIFAAVSAGTQAIPSSDSTRSVACTRQPNCATNVGENEGVIGN